MGRAEFSSAVIVQKTVGDNVKAINDINVTTSPQTINFGVNLINYLQNKGSVPLTVEFIRDGVDIGSKIIAGGYGFNDAYVQIDQIRVFTASGATTLDGMGVA